MFKSVITGTGKYIPTEIKTNRDFTVHNFYGEDQQRIETSPEIWWRSSGKSQALKSAGTLLPNWTIQTLVPWQLQKPLPMQELIRND